MKVFEWAEIANVPNDAGVYAWYYRPEISDFDLSDTIAKITAFRDSNNKASARQYLQEFLAKSIFDYFQETPYTIELHGALKPHYEGCLEHRASVSNSLIDRILEDPGRLACIKDVIESSAPEFASPIYIGMSDRLGQRLMGHKKLIEKFKISKRQYSIQTADVQNNEYRDKRFAFEICKRGFILTRLFVVIRTIDSRKNKNYVDIENILNRINYPLLGRN